MHSTRRLNSYLATTALFPGALMALMALIVLGAPTALHADDWCSETFDWGRGGRHCEVREITIDPTGGPVTVDAGDNGGIQVSAWDRNEILVEARIGARAGTEAEALDIVSRVQIETRGVIAASGPRTTGRDSWWVSFRIQVPKESDLSLEAHNGGITIEGVSGKLRFETVNGGVSLVDTSGDVVGETTNGGLSVKLNGNSWDGEGLDVETQNGGVKLAIPANYSAHLETGTVNGGMDLDYPIVVQGRLGRELELDLGSGGRTVRVMTTNGGVRIVER